MTLVVEEKPFVCLFSVSASFKVVVTSDDFYANEWQVIVGGCLHSELSRRVDFIQSCNQGSGVGIIVHKCF